MLFNSFSLFFFGPALERMLGTGRFILVYLFLVSLRMSATLLLEPLTYIHVGSSGAIFELFGYYLAIIMFRKRMLSEAKFTNYSYHHVCRLVSVMTFYSQILILPPTYSVY